MANRGTPRQVETYAVGPSNIVEFRLPRNTLKYIITAHNVNVEDERDTSNNQLRHINPTVSLRIRYDSNEGLTGTGDTGDWIYARGDVPFVREDLWIDGTGRDVFVYASEDTRISVEIFVAY